MTKTKKRKVGRPKIKLTDLRKDWREVIIDNMSEGASQEEIQAYLSISDKTMQRLEREEPEFFRTINEGRRLSRAWWQYEARTSIRDK